MSDLGKIQLIVLRIFYLLTGLGFGALASFHVINGNHSVDDSQSFISAVLYAFTLFSLAGVVLPLKMLPVLLFSLAWKSIWIMAFAIPMYIGGTLDDHTIAI